MWNLSTRITAKSPASALPRPLTSRARTSCSCTMPAKSWPGRKISPPFDYLPGSRTLPWTLSSKAVAYDGVNYGVFYDDAQLARECPRPPMNAARELGVKKIVIGECGHANKALQRSGRPRNPLRISGAARKLLCYPARYCGGGRLKLDPSRK